MKMWQQNNPFLAMLAAVDGTEPANAGAAFNNPQQQWFPTSALHLWLSTIKSAPSALQQLSLLSKKSFRMC